MRTISLITALACFLPLSHAHSFEIDYALSFGGFYGYTDYNRPKHNLYKNNNLNSTLNAYGRISHSFNNNYEASLIGYFMIDSAKELENYNQGKWGEEVFAQITSPYGELTIGQDYNVAYNFSIGAPTVGSYHNSEITNKLNMFTNMIIYCENNNLNVLNYLPLTIIIAVVWASVHGTVPTTATR